MPENIQSTEGFNELELLPDDASLSADEDLDASAALLDVDFLDQADPDVARQIPYGRSWAFDFETGQFIRHGNAPAEVADLDTLRVWIEKALRTARGAHPIYSDSYGTDYPEYGIGDQFSAETVGSLTDSITDTLLVHDRIEEIRDFNFTGGLDSDHLFVDFTVVVDDEELEFNALPLGESF